MVNLYFVFFHNVRLALYRKAVPAAPSPSWILKSFRYLAFGPVLCRHLLTSGSFGACEKRIENAGSSSRNPRKSRFILVI
jgi:hypothetical protein